MLNSPFLNHSGLFKLFKHCTNLGGTSQAWQVCVILQSLENPKHLSALSSFKGHRVVSLLLPQPGEGPAWCLLQEHSAVSTAF